MDRREGTRVVLKSVRPDVKYRIREPEERFRAEEVPSARESARVGFAEPGDCQRLEGCKSHGFLPGLRRYRSLILLG